MAQAAAASVRVEGYDAGVARTGVHTFSARAQGIKRHADNEAIMAVEAALRVRMGTAPDAFGHVRGLPPCAAAKAAPAAWAGGRQRRR